jgi:U5 snRNP spliceosome subunit
MPEAVLLALIQFAIRFGLPAAIAFFQRLGNAPTLDDAIDALGKAHAKSLEDYIAEDKLKATFPGWPPATPPPGGWPQVPPPVNPPAP